MAWCLLSEKFTISVSSFLVVYGRRTHLAPSTPSCSQALRLYLPNTFVLNPLLMIAAFVGGCSTLNTGDFLSEQIVTFVYSS